MATVDGNEEYLCKPRQFYCSLRMRNEEYLCKPRQFYSTSFTDAKLVPQEKKYFCRAW